MVGVAGFEPTTLCPPDKCATRLRYTPTGRGVTEPRPERQEAFLGRAGGIGDPSRLPLYADAKLRLDAAMNIPAFYINIDARTDRREAMERQLAQLELKVERLSASTPGDVSAEQLERHSSAYSVPFIGPSHMGCWHSHIRAMRAIVESGAEWGLVLEDDVILSRRLGEVVAAFLASDEARNLDLVQLETTARRTRVLPPVARLTTGHQLVPYRSTLYGAAGYLISRRGAMHLLSHPRLIHRQNDVTVFTPFMGPAAALRSVLVEPAVVIQLNKIEATTLSEGNIAAPKRPPAANASVVWRRRWLLWVEQAINMWDHLLHIPKGITSRVIPFDTQDQVYVGAKGLPQGATVLD